MTAGGGVTSEDLSELTREPVGEIERVIHAVTGRTFTGRDQQAPIRHLPNRLRGELAVPDHGPASAGLKVSESKLGLSITV